MAPVTDNNDMIFVFGSNLDGRHGAGAAKTALRMYGAVYGQGEGLAGQSYALPTVGHNLARMSFEEVTRHVDTFLAFARRSPEMEFLVTRLGCGLAGFTDEQIAPLFRAAPSNCHFDTDWKRWLNASASYWGTW